jgi:hypothetical protein
MYKKALSRQIKHEFLMLAFNFMPFSLLSCLLALVAHILLSEFAPAWSIVSILPPLSFATLYILELGRMLRGLYLIKHDRVIVAQDRLLAIESEGILRLGHEVFRKTVVGFVFGNRTTDTPIFEFSQYGTYVIDDGEESTRERHAIGDTFYLIMLDTKSKRPALVFNTKIYKLEE